MRAVAQDDASKVTEEHPRVASSATLLVGPLQAEAISLAGERGTVRLVLRGPNDHEIRKLRPPAIWAPHKPAAKPLAAPAASLVPVQRSVGAGAQTIAPNVVEIIRGYQPEETH